MWRVRRSRGPAGSLPPAGFTVTWAHSFFSNPVVVSTLVLSVLPGLVALQWQGSNLLCCLDPVGLAAGQADDEGIPCICWVCCIGPHPVMDWVGQPRTRWGHVVHPPHAIAVFCQFFVFCHFFHLLKVLALISGCLLSVLCSAPYYIKVSTGA